MKVIYLHTQRKKFSYFIRRIDKLSERIRNNYMKALSDSLKPALINQKDFLDIIIVTPIFPMIKFSKESDECRVKENDSNVTFFSD